MARLTWEDSWEPVETLNDNPVLLNMLTKFCTEQRARHALPPLRLFGARRDAHLTPLAQQGCHSDDEQRTWACDRVLKLTTIEHKPVNPDRDIQTGRYAIYVGNCAPDDADVFRLDGRYVGLSACERWLASASGSTLHSGLTPT